MRWIVYAVTALAVLCAIGLATAVLRGTLLPAEVTDVADVQELARIKIPASATDLRCATMKGLDRLTYERFEIPTADLKRILADMPADAREAAYSGYSNVTSHAMDEPWWQPNLLGQPRVVEWSSPGSSVNLMFRGSNRPGVLTVYFFNFSL